MQCGQIISYGEYFIFWEIFKHAETVVKWYFCNNGLMNWRVFWGYLDFIWCKMNYGMFIIIKWFIILSLQHLLQKILFSLIIVLLLLKQLADFRHYRNIFMHYSGSWFCTLFQNSSFYSFTSKLNHSHFLDFWVAHFTAWNCNFYIWIFI